MITPFTLPSLLLFHTKVYVGKLLSNLFTCNPCPTQGTFGLTLHDMLSNFGELGFVASSEISSPEAPLLALFHIPLSFSIFDNSFSYNVDYRPLLAS